jgi:hypothetical protein
VSFRLRSEAGARASAGRAPRSTVRSRPWPGRVGEPAETFDEAEDIQDRGNTHFLFADLNTPQIAAFLHDKDLD